MIYNINNLEPIRFWEYFDYISLAFIIGTIGLLIGLHYRKNQSLRKTISETVAESKLSSMAFSVTMTIFFPLYYGFLWFWVGYLINAPLSYFVLLVISGIFEMIFVWIPAKGNGVSWKIHTIASSIVGLSMVILSILILISSNRIDSIGRYAIYVFLGVSLIICIALISRKLQKYTIQLEVTFCLLFLIIMSVIGHA